ncbi:helix-turn-helix domain-containing protein [Methylobacterium sp. CM6244]
MPKDFDDKARRRAIFRRDLKRDQIRHRRQWQDRSLTVRQAAEKYDVSPTTIQKWRKRGTVEALPLGPRNPPRVLTKEERDLVKSFHRCFRLSRQDTLDALLPLIPSLKLSTVKRILVRFKSTKKVELDLLKFREWGLKTGFIDFLNKYAQYLDNQNGKSKAADWR